MFDPGNNAFLMFSNTMNSFFEVHVFDRTTAKMTDLKNLSFAKLNK